MSAVIELGRNKNMPARAAQPVVSAKSGLFSQLYAALEGRPNLAFLLFLLAVSLTAIFGAMFAPGSWYTTLVKPSWNPPSALFGPVWTTLYFLNALAAWRVLRAGHGGVAIAVWLAHLLPNALWSYLFFGLHRMDWALLDIVLLVFGIITVMTLFYRRDKWAALLLVPYLAWTSFAAFLNWTLFSLNISLNN
jgi:translocator protein